MPYFYNDVNGLISNFILKSYPKREMLQLSWASQIENYPNFPFGHFFIKPYSFYQIHKTSILLLNCYDYNILIFSADLWHSGKLKPINLNRNWNHTSRKMQESFVRYTFWPVFLQSNFSCQGPYETIAFGKLKAKFKK